MYKILLAAAIIATSAFAHFEVLFTPEVEFESGNEVKISSFFSHPFDGAPMMNQGMDRNGNARGLKEVFVIHKGQKTDLSAHTRTLEWTARGSKGQGAEITLAGANFRAGGDYGVVVVGNPYWEERENLYIQQIAKLFINKGGFDTDWQNRIVEGHTEIIPLQNPYNVTRGQIFRGKVVDNEGNPVPNVVVEAQVLNYAVNQTRAVFGAGKPRTNDDKRGENTLVTDANGVFAFVPQVAGFWGFVALFSGSDEEYNGEKLEQSALIWIKVDN